MKRALFLINNVEEEVFLLLAECAQTHPDYLIKIVTVNPHVSDWLQKQRLNCSLLSLRKTKNRPADAAKAFEIVASETYRQHCVPGTRLESWKVLLWDRFFQFMDVDTSDCVQTVLDYFDYQLLIAPLDPHDLIAQRLVRAAKRRGVPVIALVASFLRTKETLDLPLSYTKYFVSNQDDLSFLVQKKGAEASAVQLVSSRNRHETVHPSREQKKQTKETLLSQIGIAPAARIILTTFAIRHIWELRQLIHNLSPRLNLPNETAPLHLLIYPEGPLETREAETLFRKERLHTKFTLLDHTVDFAELLPITDHFICFRARKTLDMACEMGIPATVYDPFLLNRSDQLLFNGQELLIHAEKNTPVKLD